MELAISPPDLPARRGRQSEQLADVGESCSTRGNASYRLRLASFMHIHGRPAGGPRHAARGWRYPPACALALGPAGSASSPLALPSRELSFSPRDVIAPPGLMIALAAMPARAPFGEADDLISRDSSSPLETPAAPTIALPRGGAPHPSSRRGDGIITGPSPGRKDLSSRSHAKIAENRRCG